MRLWFVYPRLSNLRRDIRRICCGADFSALGVFKLAGHRWRRSVYRSAGGFRTGARARPCFSGSDFLNALAILARLAAARMAGRAGCSTAMLADALGNESAAVCALLARLEAQQWVAQLDTAAQRWI